MTRIAAIFLILLTLGITPTLHAQSDSQPPYLYYYSQLLGGLIIERADGTDSRQIAADVIPPNMSGIAGPGWSPSGKYFAAYGFMDDAYSPRTKSPYIIDTKGQPIVAWITTMIIRTSFMQWSPTGEDILLLIGSYSPANSYNISDAFIWLVDVKQNKILAEFGTSIGNLAYSMSQIGWDTAKQQIDFYTRLQFEDNVGDLYHVTIHFDGTVLREPVTTNRGLPPLVDSYPVEDYDRHLNGKGTSPNGTYTAYGTHPARLIDNRTGNTIELPVHTQATICRDYIWTIDETYMITLDGTLIAGGGCASAAMGVTNPQGTLWRELGGCDWDYPACVDWLPAQVDVRALPQGAAKPVQIDPLNIKIDTGNPIVYSIDTKDAHTLRLRCDKDSRQNTVIHILDKEADKILYTLNDVSCQDVTSTSPLKDGTRKIVVAEDVMHHLLATYEGSTYEGVRVWLLNDRGYEPLLKLNTQGYTLEFTGHDQYLRARNVNGWKTYAVADILAAATKPHE